MFGKCFSNQGYKSYQERLKILGLKTLYERRIAKDLVNFYKMLNGEFDFKFSAYFKLSVCRARENSYNRNGYSFVLTLGKKASFSHTFCQRVARWYPLLPRKLTQAKNSHTFAKMLKEVDVIATLGLERPVFWQENKFISEICVHLWSWACSVMVNSGCCNLS